MTWVRPSINTDCNYLKTGKVNCCGTSFARPNQVYLLLREVIKAKRPVDLLSAVLNHSKKPTV